MHKYFFGKCINKNIYACTLVIKSRKGIELWHKLSDHVLLSRVGLNPTSFYVYL